MNQTIRLVNNTGKLSEQNICFVNVVVQLLHSISEIRNYFLHKEYALSQLNLEKLNVCSEISKIFNQEGTCTSAAKLRQLVAHASGKSYLCDGSQQDSIEFLVTLLGVLKEELFNVYGEMKTMIDGFWGVEKLEKEFLNTPNGSCSRCKKEPRDESESVLVF